MAAQGWKPGQFLGAENANHSDHYTQANASHIRVMLRDDNLGLGAQKGKSNAETFGLSTLSGIFGRLNGKSDVEVQKQQDTQRDWQLRSYQAQKYGFMNFVSGGLLVGDKMELPEQHKVVETVDQPVKNEEAAGVKKSKKRKAEEEDGAEESGKSKKRKSKGADAVVPEASAETAEAGASKKSKKDRKKRKTDETSADSNEEQAVAKSSKKDKKRKEGEDSDDAPVDDEKRLKREKRARKEERRRRKEEKRAKKAAKEASREQSSDSSSAEEIGAAKAVQPTPAQPMFGGSRHAVRQRYIQQKRMASMNAQAMSEILMLKAGA